MIWANDYRPRTIKECVLPADLKSAFQGMVDKGEIPNLLMIGPPGVGKTTVAFAMLKELEADYLEINGSMKGNIDTLRTDIQEFASSVSFRGGRKYVLINEADYLSHNTQAGLRAFIEEFSRNCGFIFTANFKNKIMAPLSESRLAQVEFKVPKAERPALASEFHSRALEVLRKEGVEHDPKVVAQLVMRHFPDFRKVLVELQRYSSTGKVDTGILAKFSDQSLKALVDHMRDKNFTATRKWVAENSDVEPQALFRKLYEVASEHFTPDTVPQLVLLLAEYQDKATRVADQEINTAAFLVHVMSTCNFKD